MTMISGEENVRVAQLLAQRSALGLEARGMRRRGRSMLSIFREMEVTRDDGQTWEPVTRARTAKAAYKDVNDFVVELLGTAFDRPMPEDVAPVRGM